MLCGAIVGRTRTKIKLKDGTEKEKVRYRIAAGSTTYLVDQWTPETYIAVGEMVEMKVRVRVWTSKNGFANFSLSVDDGLEPGGGEAF